MKTKLYGWTEQSGCALGLNTLIVEHDTPLMDLAEEFRTYTGELDLRAALFYNDTLRNGYWFATFREAKYAVLEYWQEEIKMAQYALRQLRKLRKDEVG